MQFKTKTFQQQRPVNLCLRNMQIKQVNSTKFLGIILDETLSWKTHMQSLLKQTSSIYGTVKKSNRYLNCHSLIYFYMVNIS